MRRRERVVELLGELDLAHERVRGEGADPVATVAAPRCLGRERLVLAEHLDEPPDVARQRPGREHVDAACVAPAEHLDDQVVREAGQRAARVRHVHRMDLVLVVEDRVHHVDRELELVDAAA